MSFTSLRNLQIICLVCVALFATNLQAQINPKDVKSYQWYTANGKKVDYSEVIKSIEKRHKKNPKTVVLFGEYHDNPIAHWMELQITENLFQVDSSMVLGAEMFEADQQDALNEYLKIMPSQNAEKQVPMGMGMGKDPQLSAFEKSAKLWNNFETDYLPLVDFAKEHRLKFIATNVPRRFASLVYRKGAEKLYGLSKPSGTANIIRYERSLEQDQKLAVDSLSWGKTAANFKPGDPFFPKCFLYDSTLKCYSDMMAMSGGHGGQNLPKSQAIKDASMAEGIYNNMPAKGIYIHYNGSYHSDNHQSIQWYLEQYNSGKTCISAVQTTTTIVTISTRTQTNVNLLDKENIGLADFILVIPENMTRTYK